MKRVITMVVAGAALLAATGVFAMKGMGGMNCGMMANVKPEEARTFFKETSDLRTEMMVKKIELGQEKAKATPDAARVDALQKELKALCTKIHAAGEKYGMPPCKCTDGSCGMMDGMGQGGCGMMGGNGGGCGKMGGKGMGKGGCGKMGSMGGAPAAPAPAADQTHQH